MGKASSGKKVARAASTSGGRTSRGKTPWGWYSAMSVVVVLGVVLLVFSRNQTQERLGATKDDPPTTKDHWHSAYGFYLCDQFAPPLADNGRDPLGVHTHGDGVIHVHPFTRAATGEKAVTKLFFDTMGITVEDNRIKVGGQEFTEGEDKCGKKEAVVRVLVDGKEYKGDPGEIHFSDRQNIVFAFAPADAKIPETPPSAANLNNLTDVPGGGAGSTVPNTADNSATTSSSSVPASTSSSTPASTSSSTP